MRRLVFMAMCLIAIVSMVAAGCEGDGKPTTPPPPPTGACCAPAGTCTVTLQADCTGAWTTGGVCEPNACQQPSGSCCAPDGGCTVTTQANCTGTWTTGAVCDPNTCRQPPGSCCAPDGDCTITTHATCSGTWTDGGACAPNPCGYLPQSSPANVLANLKRAYENRDFDQYRKLFSTDFTFVFSPVDAMDPDDPTPAQWGLADEFTSTRNMFASELVNQITLDYVLPVPERADSVAWGPGAWNARVDWAFLQVFTTNESGELLVYHVDGTTERFFFREEPSRSASEGQSTWLIFRWEDQPIEGMKAGGGPSWGRIKELYR